MYTTLNSYNNHIPPHGLLLHIILSRVLHFNFVCHFYPLVCWWCFSVTHPRESLESESRKILLLWFFNSRRSNRYDDDNHGPEEHILQEMPSFLL